jgi:hypothetical protein
MRLWGAGLPHTTVCYQFANYRLRPSLWCQPVIRTGATLALVQPHPPSGLHSGSLSRGVRHLQPELERVVVGVPKPRVGHALKGGELPRDICELPGEVYCGVLMVAWATRVLRIRSSAPTP